MFKTLRGQLKKPKVRFALAGAAMSWGALTLRDLAKDTRRDLDELVDLHAETRTRVFELETIEEARRLVDGYVDVRKPTNQPTEEVQQ